MTPGAVALAAGDRVLTYRELNERAARLAGRLGSAGVGADTIVGMCLESSFAMVVGALGILKVGGAYLPLDPAYPPERLSFMLEDSGARVLLTGRRSTCSLAATCSRHVIELDEGGRLIGPASSALGRFEIGADDLAYIIYTSGSTGRPKGVEITHRSLANLVSWHQEEFAVTPADRASQLAGVGFDAAVWELWPYLAAGASVHLADDLTRSDPEALRDWLLSRGVTISFIVTPMAERILGLAWPQKAALRVVLTGGDTLHRCPPPGLPFVLVNNYGPSECTVVVTSGVVPPNEKPGERPPIGRPIANTKVHILNENLEKVPPGDPGELYIGGLGVGRGYRNQPGLTAEKFIPDPFSRELGARLYKTGDLGCSLPDGQLHFLGRIDEQIKIRGYRIEPGEIVAALNHHAAVRESAVVARERAPGEKRLVAYVVASARRQPSGDELRACLRTRLPEHMVPAAFVRLDRLPMTAHGKVDRSALPEPAPENALPDSGIDEARGPIEDRMAGVLEALLGVERLCLDGNFFEFGGHSMMGAQLIARVQETFGVELPLKTIFDHPTLRGMSAEIERLIMEKLESMEEEVARRQIAGCRGGA